MRKVPRKHLLIIGSIAVTVVLARLVIGRPAVFGVTIFLGWLTVLIGFLVSGAATPHHQDFERRDVTHLTVSFTYGMWTALVGSCGYLLEPGVLRDMIPLTAAIIIAVVCVGTFAVVAYAFWTAHGWQAPPDSRD